MNILVVCQTNRDMSPMAAHYLAHLCKNNNLPEVIVSSAAIEVEPETTIAPEAVEIMEVYGVDIKEHTPTNLTDEMLENAEMILVPSAKIQKQLTKLNKGCSSKIRKIISFIEDKDAEAPVAEDFDSFEQYFISIMPELVELATGVLRAKFSMR